jgi:hypothetical protein
MGKDSRPDPLLAGAGPTLETAYRELLARRGDPGEQVFLISNAAIEPGRAALVRQLQHLGLSEEAARREAQKRADQATREGVPIPVLEVVMAAQLASALVGSPGLSAWIASPCPADHIRVLTNDGTHWVPYHLRATWNVPTSSSSHN